ncbi:MAG: response regulator transcription factor [Planctomycetia bacterium]|nr:response regulator transcription factor [Planctomycetia bacterium]
MVAGKTILLIEDDREIATTLGRVLEGAGYTVHWGQNGLEGRRLAETVFPQLVITDMMMPKMGGFPVLEFLKSLAHPPKVIMITANEGGRHKAYAEMLGVDDYLRKPFAMEVLLEAVDRAIGSATQSADPASEEKSSADKLRRAIRKKTT